MTRRRRVLARAILTAVVGLAPLGACAGPEPPEAPEAQADGRTAIVVPAAARAAVRTEMRQMLAALSAVLRALPESAPDAIAGAARGGGMAIAVDTDPALESRLPPEFLRLGVSTHEGFDAIADAAEAGAPRDSIVARLGRLTGSCVACHEAYRLETEVADAR